MKQVIENIILEHIKKKNDNIYYHGSKKSFTSFGLNNNKTYFEIGLPVWFFTKNIKYAKTYGPFIYTVKLDIVNTFDTSRDDHFNIFMSYLREEGKSEEEIEEILDEQFYKDLPYWTNEDAYYCAVSNGFDSILIAEELENEVESIGVFELDDIEILNVKKVTN